MEFPREAPSRIVATPFDQDDGRDPARWSDAAGVTIALWLFVLLIYLPIIIERHSGEGAVSVALDGSTVFVSMLFAMPIFWLFRTTIGQPLALRVPLLVGAVLVIAIIQSIFDLLFTAWVAHNLEAHWEALPRDLARGYGAMINYISVFGVNLALFQFACSRRRSGAEERRFADILATQQQAELAALRFKLNPHFLFNTLNAISAMVVTRRNEEADLLVERLSAFLRASFNHEAMTPIPVEEELATVEHYAGIEHLRFGERVRVSIACDPAAAGLLMPPLLIQPLVEKLVETAFATSNAGGVRIMIAAWADGEALHVDVSHDLGSAPRLLDMANQCIGPRLGALYGRGASPLLDGRHQDNIVTLRLPIHYEPHDREVAR
ncbi:sensor histidine kinase [Sphingomonas sp. PR090111-T3T-6A]|uniref:sensor histidine kinase n=1 Tax=Sphingomonas sp. PR090111-T3T-6A TaxID=685778 RepID=UPI000364DAB5|nr:sensor histidine kinase [Sphingomonas sp. PR090111-T3T-6A]